MSTAHVLAGIALTCLILSVPCAYSALSRRTYVEDRFVWGCVAVALVIIAIWFGIAADTR